jgi:hypothetical protein
LMFSLKRLETGCTGDDSKQATHSASSASMGTWDMLTSK